MRDFNKVNCHYFNVLCILGATAQFKVLQEKIMTDAKRLICAQGWTFVHADRESERAVYSEKGLWSHFCIVLMNLWTAWPETYSILNNYTITITSCFIVPLSTEVCYICGCCTTGWFLLQQTETFVVVVICHHIKTVLETFHHIAIIYFSNAFSPLSFPIPYNTKLNT